MLSLLYIRVKAQQYFVSLSYMLLEKKAVLKFWLKLGLNARNWALTSNVQGNQGGALWQRCAAKVFKPWPCLRQETWILLFCAQKVIGTIHAQVDCLLPTFIFFWSRKTPCTFKTLNGENPVQESRSWKPHLLSSTYPSSAATPKSPPPPALWGLSPPYGSCAYWTKPLETLFCC